MIVPSTLAGARTDVLQQVVERFPLSRVRLLEGPARQRQDLHCCYLEAVAPDRLLAPFRLQAGLAARAERYGGWESRDISGHSLGHYLSALALMAASKGDEKLRARVHYIVTELADCQKANGDGYVLPVAKKAFEDLAVGRIEASPFALNGVWVPNYTLHKLLAGLRDAYRLADCARALGVAQQLCDWLSRMLSGLDAAQIQEMLRTEHGGMNEVLADLSADTGDRRYLEMASRYFHHDAVMAPMLRGEDRLDGLHGNTQIPKVIGLAREYELTMKPEYRRAAENFWDNVVGHRSYAIGGHGESEHFFPPEQFPRKLTPNTCETCNTYNMLKLTGHLFAWQPDARKMDFVERAMINHLWANIGRAPGEFGYFLGLEAVGVKAFSTPFDSWWCCVGTGLENPARYGEQVYSRSGDTLWINLFIGSMLDWREKGVRLWQRTRFPEGEFVRFEFTCETPVKLTLKFRHPSWCALPRITVCGNEQRLASLPSSYFTIEREWSSGDTIELRLPMALHLEPLPHSGGKTVALMYGPMVMAGLVQADPQVPDPGKKRFADHLSARGKTDEFPPVFVAQDASTLLAGIRPVGDEFAEFLADGVVVPHALVFVPFHRVYEEHYAVYLPVMTRNEWELKEQALREASRQEALRHAVTLDSVAPGYQQSEVEHAFAGENSEAGDFLDRKHREATAGGWFSYDVAVDPVQAVVLTVTYWGGEWQVRNFDIIAGGEKIGTQRLRINRPGDFFDESYPVPGRLTQGRTKITVRFQALPGDIAGRVFALHVIRAGALNASGA